MGNITVLNTTAQAQLTPSKPSADTPVAKLTESVTRLKPDQVALQTATKPEKGFKEHFQFAAERTGSTLLGGVIGTAFGAAGAFGSLYILGEGSAHPAGAASAAVSLVGGLALGAYAGATHNLEKAQNIGAGASLGMLAGNVINLPMALFGLRSEVQVGIVLATTLVGAIYGGSLETK